MRRNRRLFMNRIKNFILFIMVLIVIIGIYINFRNSRAEDVILLTAKITDIDEVIKEQVIQLSATKSDDGSYNIKMPEVINTNNVSVYYIETNKNLKVNEDGTINIDLTKEELEEKSIEVKTKYDTKEILLDEEGRVIIQKKKNMQGNTQNEQEIQNINIEQEVQEKVILYKKTLTNEEETIIVEGYMPLNVKLNTVQRNLEEEEEKNILTLGDINQTQKLEITIDNVIENDFVNQDNVGEDETSQPGELLIGEVSSIGKIGLSQEQNTEQIKEYNPKDYGETLTVRAIIDDNALLSKNEEETELLKELQIGDNTSEIILTTARNIENIKIEQEDINLENKETENIEQNETESTDEKNNVVKGIRYEEIGEKIEDKTQTEIKEPQGVDEKKQDQENENKVDDNNSENISKTTEIAIDETQQTAKMNSPGTMTITSDGVWVDYTLTHDHTSAGTCPTCGGTGAVVGYCPTCGGAGGYYTEVCDFCGGSGRNYYSGNNWAPCPQCGRNWRNESSYMFHLPWIWRMGWNMQYMWW